MKTTSSKVGVILVFLMALIQGFYAIFSYVDPMAFAVVRGTELFSSMDSDWVKIYGSRTLFITLILGYLLYVRNYTVLMWCALFGVVMPITDGILAYEAGAPFTVVIKHVATMVFLLVAFFVLRAAVREKE
ncbi:DUF4267 domain-containing protein [Zhongshania sp.]|uniref:DUF4267 domain-containing protein n=1 Tax=Zhongshania sp. TaxID=1971902 RepID=UPI0035663B6E